MKKFPSRYPVLRTMTGRPPTCDCGECRKCAHRNRQREQYRSLSLDERRAKIARRDKEKVRAADRARYRRDREKRLAAMADYAQRNRERVNKHKREWARRNPEKQREWARRNPEKRAAHVAVGNALRDGRLVRGVCEVGTDHCRGPVHAHHDDYTKPLDVRWLCVYHHEQWHHEEAACPTLTTS